MTRSTLPGPAPASTEDILQRVAQVPERHSFPTVDALTERFAALARDHADSVTVREAATSTLGEPIPCYTIGQGRLACLIVGGVHPNEPIGSWTAVHLAEQLTSDRALLDTLDATWHIIPCIDPDGTRLNEGWFDSPQDRGYYARRFYRPAPDRQVEWSFPFTYKQASFDQPLPETRGLMAVIDEVRPDLYVSLHNAEMGGVYYYLSRPVPELYEHLHAVPESLGLPLHKGEPEAPFLAEYAPAIYGCGTTAEAYDYLEQLGLDPTVSLAGSSSSEYASRYNTLTLIAELPYWAHPEADDDSPTDESYSDVLRRTGRQLKHTAETLAAILEQAEPRLTLSTPFLHASRAFVPLVLETAKVETSRAGDPATDRPATAAERFSCADLVHCFRLRYGGMLLRALEAEVTAGIAPASLRRQSEQMSELYAGWQEQAASADKTEVIPVSKLVGVQYGAILTAAAYVARSQ